MASPVPNLSNHPTDATHLGGPFQGYSPQQTITSYKDSEQVMSRRILRNAWNTPYAAEIGRAHV